MADWSELDDGERSFAVAHLAYLNVLAQATTQRLLGGLLDALEDVEHAIEALAAPASIPGTVGDLDELDHADLVPVGGEE